MQPPVAHKSLSLNSLLVRALWSDVTRLAAPMTDNSRSRRAIVSWLPVVAWFASSVTKLLLMCFLLLARFLLLELLLNQLWSLLWATKSKSIYVHLIVVIGTRNLKASVAKHALRSVFAEASEVVRTRDAFHMTMTTFGPVLAEPSGIVRALIALFIKINMSVHALWIGAFAKL